MDMRSIKEKRHHPRVGFNRVVRIATDGQILQSLGINYSQGGMAFHSKQPFTPGEFIELNFRPDESLIDCQMTAEVIRSVQQSNSFITGVRFLTKLVLASQ